MTCRNSRFQVGGSFQPDPFSYDLYIENFT